MSDKFDDSCHPSFCYGRREALDEVDVRIAVVEAGDVAEPLAAGVHEDLAVLALDLLQRLEAVGGEGGRDHRHFAHPAGGKRLHRLVDRLPDLRSLAICLIPKNLEISSRRQKNLLREWIELFKALLALAVQNRCHSLSVSGGFNLEQHIEGMPPLLRFEQRYEITVLFQRSI